MEICSEQFKYLNIANHSNQIVLKTNAAIEQSQFIESRQIPNDKANIETVYHKIICKGMSGYKQ